MKQLLNWSFAYGLPVSALFLGVVGVLFSIRMKTRWSIVVTIGSLLTAIALLIQRFVPIGSATLDPSSNEVISRSGPIFIRTLAGIMPPIGIIIIAAGLLWGSMSSKTERNT